MEYHPVDEERPPRETKVSAASIETSSATILRLKDRLVPMQRDIDSLGQTFKEYKSQLQGEERVREVEAVLIMLERKHEKFVQTASAYAKKTRKNPILGALAIGAAYLFMNSKHLDAMARAIEELDDLIASETGKRSLNQHASEIDALRTSLIETRQSFTVELEHVYSKASRPEHLSRALQSLDEHSPSAQDQTLPESIAQRRSAEERFSNLLLALDEIEELEDSQSVKAIRAPSNHSDADIVAEWLDDLSFINKEDASYKEGRTWSDSHELRFASPEVEAASKLERDANKGKEASGRLPYEFATQGEIFSDLPKKQSQVLEAEGSRPIPRDLEGFDYLNIPPRVPSDENHDYFPNKLPVPPGRARPVFKIKDHMPVDEK